MIQISLRSSELLELAELQKTLYAFTQAISKFKNENIILDEILSTFDEIKEEILRWENENNESIKIQNDYYDSLREETE